MVCGRSLKGLLFDAQIFFDHSQIRFTANERRGALLRPTTYHNVHRTNHLLQYRSTARLNSCGLGAPSSSLLSITAYSHLYKKGKFSIMGLELKGSTPHMFWLWIHLDEHSVIPLVATKPTLKSGERPRQGIIR
jgi:hypothetical protein